jgi:hypothetical protein
MSTPPLQRPTPATLSLRAALERANRLGVPTVSVARVEVAAAVAVVEAARRWLASIDVTSTPEEADLALALGATRDTWKPAEADVPRPCTCPWNNGYLRGADVLGHWVACPSLAGAHHAADACGRPGVPGTGHRD